MGGFLVGWSWRRLCSLAEEAGAEEDMVMLPGTCLTKLEVATELAWRRWWRVTMLVAVIEASLDICSSSLQRFGSLHLERVSNSPPQKAANRSRSRLLLQLLLILVCNALARMVCDQKSHIMDLRPSFLAATEA